MALGLAASGIAAQAEPIYATAPFANPAAEPNAPQACAPHQADFTVPGLWLGHFTGGRFTPVAATGPGVLDWKDQYSCFPTLASCQRWQRENLRAYRRVEGYRTCVALRGGGVPIHREHVIIAKY